MHLKMSRMWAKLSSSRTKTGICQMLWLKLLHNSAWQETCREPGGHTPTQYMDKIWHERV